MDRVGESVAAAMSAARGLHHLYGRGTAEGLMYLASGTFVDWIFVTHRHGPRLFTATTIFKPQLVCRFIVHNQ